MDKNNQNNSLHYYLKKWKKANRTMKKKETALEEAMKNLDYINKMKKTEILNSAFVNKKLFNTVKNVKKLIALRKLRQFAKEDKKNTDLSEGLTNAYNEISKDHKRKLMTKLEKIYAYKILDNLMNKLSQIQMKKSLEPKSQFMNKLNLISIYDKEFGYKLFNEIDKKPKTKKLHFKMKEKEIPEKEIQEKDLLENKIKSNAIAYRVIIPELIDYLNDIFIKRNKEAYELIKCRARNEKFVNHLKSHINKNYLSDKRKLYDYLKLNQRIQLTERPLQAKLFTLLGKKILNKIFDKGDV